MSWRTEVADAVAARSESAGGYVRVNCPACVERAGKFDRQRSLSVNTGNGWWLCHRCGWRGRLAGYDDDSDAWEDREPREAPEVEQPSDYQPVTRELGQLTLAPHRYLRSRGVEPRVVREARIGYAMRGDHAGRIILPLVPAEDWREVGWVGRDLTGRQRRYHVSSGVDGQTTFYNDDQLGADELGLQSR